MKIYLVRHAHAKTRANMEGIVVYDNQKSKGLTEKGKKQAKKLAEKFAELKIDKIFVSEARRTYETILPLIKLEKTIPVEKNKNLNECEFGIFSGLTAEEAEKKYPKIFTETQKDKWSTSIPKGESLKDAAVRLDFFLKNLEKEAEKSQLKNILLVTHYTIVQTFLIKYGAIRAEKINLAYFGNTSVSVFNFKNGLIKPLKINDCSHLNKSIIS